MPIKQKGIEKMISEKRLQELENLYDKAPHSSIFTDSTKDEDFIEEAYAAVPALIARVRELEAEHSELNYSKLSHMYLVELTKRQRLEKEADWLSDKLHKIDTALHGDGVQKICWREMAKGAVALAAKQKEQEEDQ